MGPALHEDGTWELRPGVGAQFLGPRGEEVEISAVWEAGAVFDSGRAVSAFELVAYYKPRCRACGSYHEPEYPHELTPVFKANIRRELGRRAQRADTYSHCTGLIRVAVESAMGAA